MRNLEDYNINKDYSINLVHEIELAKQRSLNHLNNPDVSGDDKKWWQQLPEEFQQQWQTLNLDMRAALCIYCRIVADRSDYEQDIFCSSLP